MVQIVNYNLTYLDHKWLKLHRDKEVINLFTVYYISNGIIRLVIFDWIIINWYKCVSQKQLRIAFNIYINNFIHLSVESTTVNAIECSYKFLTSSSYL